MLPEIVLGGKRFAGSHGLRRSVLIQALCCKNRLENWTRGLYCSASFWDGKGIGDSALAHISQKEIEDGAPPRNF